MPAAWNTRSQTSSVSASTRRTKWVISSFCGATRGCWPPGISKGEPERGLLRGMSGILGMPSEPLSSSSGLMPSIRQMAPITSSEVMLSPPPPIGSWNAAATAAAEHAAALAAAILDVGAFPVVFAVSHG